MKLEPILNRFIMGGEELSFKIKLKRQLLCYQRVFYYIGKEFEYEFDFCIDKKQKGV